MRRGERNGKKRLQEGGVHSRCQNERGERNIIEKRELLMQ